MGQEAHFVSIPFPLSQGERGMRQLAHFISQALSRSHNSSALSLKEREGWDGSVTFCSFAALRVTAGGRNP